MMKSETMGRFALLAVAMMISVSSYAQIVIGNFKYKLNDATHTAGVTGRVTVNGSWVDDVVIPASVSYGNVQYSVTSVCSKAFESTSITSVSIPASVNEIENNAFRRCERLEKITVDANNKVFDSRNNCNAIIHTETGELIAGCNGTVVPEGVTRIGSRAFDGSHIETLVLPNTVTSIGYYAFINSMITKIVLPESLSKMDFGAFFCCFSLESINLPDALTVLEDDVLAVCLGLTELTLPNNLKKISYEALASCSFKKITIPATVEEIGEEAFESCDKLRDVNFLSTTPPVFGVNVFHDDSNVTIHVPRGYKKDYERVPELKGMTIVDDLPSPTGIGCVLSSDVQRSAAVYSLGGQRLSRAPKGLVIVGGKKVLVDGK